jgi:hypothetical protein
VAFPYLTDDEIKASLAAMLQIAVGASGLTPSWESIVPEAHDTGWKEVRAKLLGMYYSVAQLDTWSQRQEYERDQSLYWALVKGAADRVELFPYIDRLNRLGELDVLVLIDDDGEILIPEGAYVGSGRMSEAEQFNKLGLPYADYDPSRRGPYYAGD